MTDLAHLFLFSEQRLAVWNPSSLETPEIFRFLDRMSST